MRHTLPTKAIKLIIPVDLDDFPVGAIPPPGTPGGKGVIVDVTVQTADGTTLTASLKGSGLQRLLAAIKEAPQGGFVVLQGKLVAGNTIAEAGVIFQPRKINPPTDAEQGSGQMPVHDGP